jgi:outer membrane protein assembly factor BamB
VVYEWLNDPCIVQGGDYSESILALDLDTGKIVWGNHLGGVDVWNVACLSGLTQPNCPPAAGPDYDFGEAPMLLTVPKIANKSKGESRGDEVEWRDIVVAGQKSGFVWALDCDDGHVVWDAVSNQPSLLPSFPPLTYVPNSDWGDLWA